MMRKSILFIFIIIVLGITAYFTIKFFNVDESYSATEFTLNLASLFITTILTYYLVSINDKLYKKENAERLDNLRKSAYILKTEINQIYQVFANILMSKNSKKIKVRIDITDDWKHRVALFSGYLPKPCLDHLFSLFLFVERINSTEANKSVGIHSFKEYIEINNIEYYESKSDWILLTSIQTRLVLVFLNRVIEGNVEKVTDRYKDEGSLYLVSEDGINGTLKDFNSKDKEITTSYHNNRIEKQYVKISDTVIRDIYYGETGLANGKDKFTIDTKRKYSKLYRREWDGTIRVNFGPRPTDEKLVYQGYVIKNKLDGVASITKNGKPYQKGSFIEGELISGEMYNVEVNRRYKEKQYQQNYEAEKYYSSDEYIEREIEAQEARYEEFLEEERHYTSIRADFKVVDGKKEEVNTREVIVLKMDSDDYV